MEDVSCLLGWDSEPMILVSYSFTGAYMIFYPKTKHISINIDVVVNELKSRDWENKIRKVKSITFKQFEENQ